MHATTLNVQRGLGDPERIAAVGLVTTPRASSPLEVEANMAAPMEVVVCADSAGQLWNCAVFELHSGTNLLSYRGGNSSPRSLTLLNGEFILGAQLGKNIINVWEIQRKVLNSVYLERGTTCMEYIVSSH